jgi:predicted ferric reductase
MTAQGVAAEDDRVVLDYQVVLPLVALVAVAFVTLSGAGSTMVWEAIRASGVVAYAVLTASVCAGLMVRTRALPPGQARVDAFEVHNFTALLVLAFGGFHALALLLDNYIGFSPAQILVPLTSTYRPVAVALGILTLYAAGALYGSFWLRRLVGYRTWRVLHYGSFVAFTLATLHGILSGADSGMAWMIAVYAVAVATVLALLVYRLAGRRQPAARPVVENTGVRFARER